MGKIVKMNRRERQMLADHEWVLNNEEVQQQYQGQVVAAFKQQIIGAGSDYQEARAAALQHPRCPNFRYLVLIPIPSRHEGAHNV